MDGVLWILLGANKHWTSYTFFLPFPSVKKSHSEVGELCGGIREEGTHCISRVFWYPIHPYCRFYPIISSFLPDRWNIVGVREEDEIGF